MGVGPSLPPTSHCPPHLHHGLFLLHTHELVVAAVDQQCQRVNGLVVGVITLRPLLAVHCVLEHVAGDVEGVLLGDARLALLVEGIPTKKSLPL